MKIQEVIDKVNSGKHIIYKRLNIKYEVREKTLSDGRKFLACINPNNERDYASLDFIFESQQYLETSYFDKKFSFEDLDIKGFEEV